MRSVPEHFTHRRFVELAVKDRLPAIYGWREGVEIGGLMAYASNIAELYRHAADQNRSDPRRCEAGGSFAALNRSGLRSSFPARPICCSVELATKFELIISLAGTALAQQRADPQLKQQAETIYSKLEKALNDYNASALKDLETPDAFNISAFGIETSRTREKGAERNRSMGVNTKGSVKEVPQIDADTALSRGLHRVRPPHPATQARVTQTREPECDKVKLVSQRWTADSR